MLCVTLKKYTRACGSVSGGISDIVFFDPFDFDFTNTTTSGVVGPYTVIEARTGAETLGKVYPVTFQQDEAEWKWTQSRKGCSVKYDHEFDFQLPDNSQQLTNFLSAMDAAACCCGLGMIIRLNNGKIFIAGERFVNSTEQPRFTITQDGSTGTSGKLIDDFNGGNLVFKGSYTRNLLEYTGDWADVTALVATT